MWFTVGGLNLVLVHDPAAYTVIENGPIKQYMLCGHIHGLFKHLLPQKRIINVVVDVWDYKPVSVDEIIKLIKENTKANDKHNNQF